ncbi:MAG: hypothetical protein ACRCZJ_07690 [Erysipelotrichaceae bacterium]
MKQWIVFFMLILFGGMSQSVKALEDLSIHRIGEKTQVYLGASVDVEARINGTLAEGILWEVQSLDGAANIMSLAANGNQARLTAKQSGRVELKAQIAGSEVMRFLMMEVVAYPKDEVHTRYQRQGINPVFKQSFYDGTSLLQVEPKSNLQADAYALSLSNLFAHLSTFHTLTWASTDTTHQRFTYVTIYQQASSMKLEIKLDKQHPGYQSALQVSQHPDKQILEDSTPQPPIQSEPEEKPEESEKPKEPSKPSVPTKPITPSEPSEPEQEQDAQLPQVEEEVTNKPQDNKTPTQTESEEETTNPQEFFPFEQTQSDTTDQQADVEIELASFGMMLAYLRQFEADYTISVEQFEDDKQPSFLFHLRSKLGTNDFTIQILIQDDVVSSFQPSIQMLESQQKKSDLETQAKAKPGAWMVLVVAGLLLVLFTK